MVSADSDSGGTADNLCSIFHMTDPTAPASQSQAWWTESTQEVNLVFNKKPSNPWHAVALFAIIAVTLVTILLLLL